MNEVITKGRLASSGLLVLRIAVGGIFIAHGFQKAFAFTIPGTIKSFTALGVPLPVIVAPAVTVLEVLGGLLLCLGLGTRIVGGLFVVDMAGAVFFARLAGGFWVDQGGYEFVALLGAASLAIVLTGAGGFALDRLLSRRGILEGAMR